MDIPPAFKKIGVKNYLYGDIDKDGTLNIDDLKPYDKDINEYPNIKTNPTYYHKARYGGTEIKLSDALKTIENRNNEHIPLLNRFLTAYPNGEARIKTVPSTIDKLEKKYGHNITDRGAGTILTDNRKQAFQQANKFTKVFPTDRKLFDNYYAKPKESHYGLHFGVKGERNTRMEVQIKSKAMNKIDIQAHEHYKKGSIPKDLIKKAQRLFRMGF